ncbi:MAG: copper transporter [Dethiobacter sp.]|jgi:hypothetical protein|nr:copper transporter [Dethiobacter sp.]MBS3983387.1 copper transporter [Dethiobacter sp.]MCL4462667.1 copper transporter [Bacillota bacterium]MCL5994119.1 copper transporter [Bacillota bacterium]
MFRIKDHVISLVAVFLALGLGILIGTTLSDEMLITQQRLLIEQMTKEQKGLREERRAMEARLQTVVHDLSLWKKYQEALYPILVSGALTGKRVSVIVHGAEMPPGVLEILRDADAILCNLIRIRERQALNDTASGVGAALAALTANELLTAEMEESLAPFLADERILLEQLDRGKPDAVILVLGELEFTDKRLVNELVAGLPQDRFTVVGLEWSSVRASLFGQLRAAGISTIDNADTVFGQVSLLAVLRGNAGNFGIKSSAEQLMANF